MPSIIYDKFYSLQYFEITILYTVCVDMPHYREQNGWLTLKGEHQPDRHEPQENFEINERERERERERDVIIT